MNLVDALQKVVDRRPLSRLEMGAAMRSMMSGQATSAQIAGFLVALRMKGETVDELTGAVEVMRELATLVPVHADFRRHLIDTCGTGGDGAGLFNVSTASAFVVAAAGGTVAKHGNRSVSGSSGSADVLEAAGVRLDLSAAAVARCVEQVGVGFMFAPVFHSAMRHAIGPRREMGVRTMFNLLGPLTNPAAATRQVIGVFDRQWLRPLAEVLLNLGADRVLVVHSDDGLDEISIAAPTRFAELKDGAIAEGVVLPAELGIEPGDIAGLKVSHAQHSLILVRSALQGEPGPARDIVALNAGAALYVAGLADDLRAAVALAQRTLASGKPDQKLAELARFSRSLAGTDTASP